ncbi:MAG TPA: DUF2007 domain-containing protein [Candidatus Sulfotelmatobacter sp.]
MAEVRQTAAPAAVPDPNEKLVKVFDTEQESEAMIVKGLLESAGIESNLTSTSTAQDAFPGLGGVILMVREEDAEPARRLLAESRKSAGASSNEMPNDAQDDDATSEIDLTTGLPPKKA